MKRRIFPLVATLALPLHARDLVPEYWLEDIPANDQSLQKCLVFRTVAGVGYRVESSADLDSWQTDYQLYGMGHEFVVPVHEIAPPPPPDPEEDPPPALPPALHVTLQLQPSSATEGGTVVTWKSLDHGGPVIYRIAEAMHADWQTVPLFAERHENHYFFVTHPSVPAAPPAANPQLGPLDEAMIEVLDAHLDDMNETVANSAEVARNTPPPAPPSSDSRRFYRIHADWSIDTDIDRSPDWAEFEVAANAAHAFQAIANPFNHDVNDDGVPDGEQIDRDGDGTMDAYDAAPDEPAIDQLTFPEPRYGLFPIAGAEPPSYTSNPIQINDRGKVLYVNGVWSGGQWIPLAAADGNLSGCVARGINASDEIIGLGSYQISAENGTHGPVMVHWATPDAAPTAVSLDGVFSVPTQDLTYNPYAGPVFSDGGQMLSQAARIAVPEGGTQLNFVPEEAASRQLWTVDGPGRAGARQAVAAGQSLISSEGLFWGYDPVTSKGKLGWGNYPPLDWIPRNVVEMRPGMPAAFGPNGTVILQNGNWRDAGTYSLAGDSAENGIAIGRRNSGRIAPVLINNQWRPIMRAASYGLPEEWQHAGVSLTDISGLGWILARREATEENHHAVMLPLRVEGQYIDSQGETVEDAVGVDDFSVAADSMSGAARDRLWVMVPKEEAKPLRLRAPLGAGSTLEIEAEGITFGGNASLELSGDVTTTAVQATGATTSGDEILADLKLQGTVPSASKPLGFKVMKHRGIRVAVYKVIKADASGNHEFTPNLVPDEDELEDYLNDVFLPQINTAFWVKIEPTPLVVNWDTENANESLDGTNSDGTLSDEQGSIEAAKNALLQQQAQEPDYLPFNADITVYMVGGRKPIDTNATGLSNRENRICWVIGNPVEFMNSSNLLPYDPVSGPVHTIAHEIGHILVGPGHPDQTYLPGPGRLPGTDHRQRLMCSGNIAKLIPGKLLVKGEWDAAEEWLSEFIDSPFSP